MSDDNEPRLMWKVDGCEIRAVMGTPYPGLDDEGDTCLENTHTKTREAAVNMLRRDTLCRVKFAAEDIERIEDDLRRRHGEAVEAAKGLAKVIERYGMGIPGE